MVYHLLKNFSNILPDGGKFVQLTLQDLPEVPSAIPSGENVEEKLDLPDVPTKAPVVTEAVMEDTQDTSAGMSVQKKGYYFYSLSHTHTLFSKLSMFLSFLFKFAQFWRNQYLLDASTSWLIHKFEFDEIYQKECQVSECYKSLLYAKKL